MQTLQNEKMMSESGGGPVVVSVGEVLWDLLPGGRQPGGAPANFACHAQALGAAAQMITRVGNDAPGRELTARLRSFGLPPATMQVDDRLPTGTVDVVLAEGGQPRYTINPGAWDAMTLTGTALAAAEMADVICFGSLAQRQAISRQTIQKLVAATPFSALRIFDINLRQKFYSREIIEESLQLANILKLNDGELPLIAEMFGVKGAVADQLKQLARRFELRLVALTRGSQGSLLVTPSRCSDHPGLPVKVRDTVGAGDAFTAAVAMGLLHYLDLDEINEQANELAAYVCSQDGAIPELPVDFRNRFAQMA